MNRAFKKELGSLEDIFAFLAERMDTMGVDPASAYAINVAVEEFFTNMVKYSTRSRNDVTIDVDGGDGKVTVVLADRDVDPFDVRHASGADISAPPEQWSPGGLGLHITKSLVDSVDYRYENQTSIVTFTKTLKR